MWFVGLLLGLIIGSAFGGAGAGIGAVLGCLVGLAFAGRRPEEPTAGPGDSAEARLARLESAVEALRLETGRLRSELSALRRGQPAVPVAPEPVAPVSESALPASPAPAIFIDETPTQPGYDLPQPVADPGTDPAPPAARGAAAPEASPAVAMPPEPGLGERLLAGNILAKVGVVLLFFGVASALRLAAEYGYLPLPLRLLMGAVAGVAMVAFGWNTVRQGSHATFGIAVQGGGFAILYLIVYFMLARYGLLGPTPAFVLFALLGVACVLLAAAQDGVVLAVFGLAGAFAAPVLASTGSGDPLGLFGYFALLNAFIVGVSWFKAWRPLNVTGFFFTLGVGVAWALQHYHAGHHDVCQGFLVFFWALYAATPVLMALFRAPGWAGWSDATLVFGTPLVGFALQSQLAADRFELAWAAFAAALAYGALWGLLFRRGAEERRLLERCQLGLAIAFATLAVPLAFGVQVTSAFWALEGAAVLWFGVAQGRRLAMATGSLLQGAAGAYFLYGLERLATALPVINDVCLGAALLAGAGFASARLLRRFAEGPAALALLWAFGWWCFGGFQEIRRLTPDDLAVPLVLVDLALTLVVLEVHGRAQAWPAARHLGMLLLPALVLAALATFARSYHLLAGLMVLALPLALAVHYWLLARQEADQAALGPILRHIGGFWLIIALVSVEAGWLGDRLAPDVRLWPVLALALGPVVGIGGASLGFRRGLAPFVRHSFAYLGLGSLVPALYLVLWVFATNFSVAGDGSGLPYVPVLNPFDLMQLAALAVLYGWLGAVADEAVAALPVPRPIWLGGLAFVWISCLAARIAHHWAGVPFTGHALWHSQPVQAMLTLLWTALAIAAMIRAAGSGGRRLWQGGFVLLAVVGAKLMFVDLAHAGTLVWTGSLIGVALLVLAAGYFAPAPPAADAEERP